MAASFDPTGAVGRALAWLGVRLPDASVPRLVTYVEWLRSEALAAGGLGPEEGPRLWERHIADSLLLAHPWSDQAPQNLADLGSGVGLPGIPLALLFPSTKVTLVDRSGRRCRLLRRAARVIDIDVEVLQADVDALAPRSWDALVSRALFPTQRLVPAATELLSGTGTAMFAVSHGHEAPEEVVPPQGYDLEWMTVPQNVLDSTVWLLRMQRRDHQYD